MISIIELIILIAVLFGAQKYLSTLEPGWLGLITPVIFTIYMFIKFYYLDPDIEFFWLKLGLGNLVLLSDYNFGQKKKKERYKKELENMKSKDL
ncbi:hypothetical protein GTN31_06705 [Macrococcoides canis]|uniref:hypothetical protein n=1 Tax=Macrococcoides canis TaxID=1855823 RepID=UPI0013E9858B|nr:hypothetical protein [Macrococcus canis]QIH76046.1 hypothetical protein GTN31_06705 [Macrococcus canis]